MVEEEFRPAYGRGLTVVVGVLGVVIAVAAAASGIDDAIATMPWVLLFVTCCWAIFWNPRVVVADEGVRLVNVTRTIDIAWSSIADVESRYALTLVTTHGRFEAWAAPPPIAGGVLRTGVRSRPVAVDESEPVTTGEIRGRRSGDAATIVRQRWDLLRAVGFVDDARPDLDGPPIRWHWKTGLIVAGLAALSIGSLIAT